MCQKDMIVKTDSSKRQFEAVVSTLYALTLKRMDDKDSHEKFKTDKNPLGLTSITQLSNALGWRFLIQRQFKEGSPSYQLWDVSKLLIKYSKDSSLSDKVRTVSKQAALKITQYVKETKKSAQDIGDAAHPVLEALFVKWLVSKGVDVAFEFFTPEGKQPDMIINRDERYKNVENDLILDLGDEIECVVADFYAGTTTLTIEEKIKKYQGENRFVIVVLYGKTTNDRAKGIDEWFHKKKPYKNYKILSLQQFRQYLGVNLQNNKVDQLQGIERSTYKAVQRINELVKNSLDGKNKDFLELMNEFLIARNYLKNFKIDFKKFELLLR